MNNSRVAELKEIRPKDGAQMYKCVDGEIVWLMGWNRARGVKVGDKGTLKYQVGRNYGLWFFTRENTENERN